MEMVDCEAKAFVGVTKAIAVVNINMIAEMRPTIFRHLLQIPVVKCFFSRNSNIDPHLPFMFDNRKSLRWRGGFEATISCFESSIWRLIAENNKYFESLSASTGMYVGIYIVCFEILSTVERFDVYGMVEYFSKLVIVDFQ